MIIRGKSRNWNVKWFKWAIVIQKQRYITKRNRHQTILKQLACVFVLGLHVCICENSNVMFYCVILHWVCLLWDVRTDLWIHFLVSRHFPARNSQAHVMLLVNEILNMTDILVQKMLSYFKIRVGLFSRVLLWIIACHLRLIFFAKCSGFCQVSHETRCRK